MTVLGLEGSSSDPRLRNSLYTHSPPPPPSPGDRTGTDLQLRVASSAPCRLSRGVLRVVLCNSCRVTSCQEPKRWPSQIRVLSQKLNNGAPERPRQVRRWGWGQTKPVGQGSPRTCSKRPKEAKRVAAGHVGCRGGEGLSSGRHGGGQQMTTAPPGRGGGGWHKASASGCLPLAVPTGLAPLLILTLCGSERVLVVSTEPLDDLS